MCLEGACNLRGTLPALTCMVNCDQTGHDVVADGRSTVALHEWLSHPSCFDWEHVRDKEKRVVLVELPS